jgi:hypothetical protein
MIPLSRVFFLAIVFYLLYRFVFNFLVPLFRTTKQVRDQFRNMQDHMQQGRPFQQPGNPFQPQGSPFQQQYARPQEPAEPSSPPSKNSMGEYIDFEEVKDK